MTSPIPRVLAYLLLALTALVVAHRGVLVRRATDTRMLVYALDEPVELALSAGDTAARIVTWLEGPEPDLLDTWQAWPYAVRARVIDEGAGARVDQIAWLSTRVGLVPDEPTLVPITRASHGHAATDDRLILLPFAAPLPAPARLRLEAVAVPSGLRVGIAAFRATERTALVQQRLRAGQHRDGPHLLAPLAPFGFADLGEARASRLVARGWQRLGAITRLGRAPPRIELYTAFDDQSLDETTARAWPTRPGEGANLSIRGPASVSARWLHPHGVGPAAVDTWVRVLGPGGHVQRLERLGLVTHIDPIHVPDVGAVQVVMDPSQGRPALLEWTVRGGALIGDPPRVVQPDGDVIAAPDAIRADAWRALAGAPLRFPVTPHDRVRVIARRPLPTSARGGFGVAPSGPPTAVRLVWLDADDAVIAQEEHPLARVASPFDRYFQGDAPRDHALSEPTIVTLTAPEGARWLRVSAVDVVDVRLLRDDPTAPPYEVQRPWADLPLPLGPLPPRFTRWAAVAPDDVEGLLTARRLTGWLLQIVPRIEDPSPDTVVVPKGAEEPAWVAALKAPKPTPTPRAPRPAFTPFEPIRPFDLVVRERSGDGRLLDGDGVGVVVPDSGVLEIDHRVPLGDVGDAVTVTVGDRSSPRVAYAAAGRWRLEELEPGPTLARVDHAGTFVARGQPQGDRLVQRVWRIPAHGTVTLPLPPVQAVRVAVWAETGARGVVGWSFGGASGTLGLGAASDEFASPLSWAGGVLAEQPTIEADGDGPLVLRGADTDVWVRLAIAPRTP